MKYIVSVLLSASLLMWHISSLTGWELVIFKTHGVVSILINNWLICSWDTFFSPVVKALGGLWKTSFTQWKEISQMKIQVLLLKPKYFTSNTKDWQPWIWMITHSLLQPGNWSPCKLLRSCEDLINKAKLKDLVAWEYLRSPG